MGSQAQLTPAQLNTIARSAIKSRAIKMTQQIFNQTYASANVAASQPVVNVIPRNVGLILGFWVKVSLTINNGSSETMNVSDFSAWNALSQIQFNDLNNNTRIQTTGWHLAMINSIKARRPFDAAILNDALGGSAGGAFPVNVGANWQGQISATTGVVTTDNATVVMWYWVPLAYSDNDYRGAVYANVVNATMQLNLTLNPQVCAANPGDSTSTMYKLASAATDQALVVITSATVQVYQVYLDQLPTAQGGAVLLPMLDLATIYEFKNTSFTGITSGQDFPMQYANFRDFLSSTFVYVNTASTGARGVGSDLSYLALQSANFTNIWKMNPDLFQLINRNHLQVDPPPGVYYSSSRDKPISTVQYGNMQFILNAITANTGAYVLAGYEDFALVQTLSQAGSLAAN